MATQNETQYWLDVFKKELYEEIIPWWLTFSIDNEHGGFFNCIHKDGSLYDTSKYVWLQGRQVWMFAKLYGDQSFEDNLLKKQKSNHCLTKDALLKNAISGADLYSTHNVPEIDEAIHLWHTSRNESWRFGTCWKIRPSWLFAASPSQRRVCPSSVLAHHTSVSPQTLGIIPPVAPRSHFIWGFLKWRRVRRGMVWHRQSCPVPWQPGWSHKNIKEDFDWWGSHLPAQNPHTISNCILYLGLSSGRAKTANISVSVDNRQFSFKGFIFIFHVEQIPVTTPLISLLCSMCSMLHGGKL